MTTMAAGAESNLMIADGSGGLQTAEIIEENSHQNQHQHCDDLQKFNKNNNGSKTNNITNNNNNNNKNNKNNNKAVELVVEPCKIEFFYEKFKQCYPMFRNPRGQCLIINIYQIDEMPPRRWSDRDTESLKQLFEQLLFTVSVYTDTTHCLDRPHFTQIVQQFAAMSEHAEAQCSVICLMSHGEEGYLTTKEGDKVPLDDIFSMFNNVNCPNLAGKPKLFFIQSCRDDPITGPAEDLGIKLSFNNSSPTNSKEEMKEKETDQSDGSYHLNLTNDDSDSNNNNNNNTCTSTNVSPSPPKVSNSCSYHIPSLCDILVGFPTQKGFIAYRKPEMGSWYMNAIVQVFSQHSHDTDVCAMLNMVNSMISNEVTNTGKKQMSEYTSKLTKPYFFFFPGLASSIEDEEDNQEEEEVEEDHEFSHYQQKKKQRVVIGDDDDCEDGDVIEVDQSDSNNIQLQKQNAKQKQPLFNNRNHQPNPNRNVKANTKKMKQEQKTRLVTGAHIRFVADRARLHWKHIAREMCLSESHICEIDETNGGYEPKLESVLNKWLKENEAANENENKNENGNNDFNRLTSILGSCRLNKIKDELISTFGTIE